MGNPLELWMAHFGWTISEFTGKHRWWSGGVVAVFHLEFISCSTAYYGKSFIVCRKVWKQLPFGLLPAFAMCILIDVYIYLRSNKNCTVYVFTLTYSNIQPRTNHQCLYMILDVCLPQQHRVYHVILVTCIRPGRHDPSMEQIAQPIKWRPRRAPSNFLATNDLADPIEGKETTKPAITWKMDPVVKGQPQKQNNSISSYEILIGSCLDSFGVRISNQRGFICQ